uniref:PPM-type phosphatase domain-containing protein n=1 Tax=Romanomermis culicivorax TaxID=13658 RepID=A0A915JTK1_ROMCU
MMHGFETSNPVLSGILYTDNCCNKRYKVSENWPKTASGYNSTSGTTASIAIVKNGKVYIGHVGDSGIVLGEKSDRGHPEKIIAHCLTVEHKPDSVDEIERITHDGGEVINKFGVARVVWNRPVRGHQGPVRRSTSMEKVPFLAVSRSLGDLWSYNASLDRFVVSPEPQVAFYNVDKSTACIILGSDGLWNVIKPFHAVHIIDNAMCESNDFNLVNGASHLVNEALSRWGRLRADNISAVALIFPSFTTNKNELKENYQNFKMIEHPRLILDEVFKSRPCDSILRLNENTTEILRCKKVELEFYGASDCCKLPLQFDNTTTAWHDYSGPGYIPKEDDWSIFTSESFEQIFTYQEECLSFSFSDISGIKTPIPPLVGEEEKHIEKPQFFLTSPAVTPKRRNLFTDAFVENQILLPSRSKEKLLDNFIIAPLDSTSPPKYHHTTSFFYNLRSCSPFTSVDNDVVRPMTPPPSTFVADLATSLPFFTLRRHRLTPVATATRRSAPHIYARSRISANVRNTDAASATLIRPQLRRVAIFGRLNEKKIRTPERRCKTRLGLRSCSSRLIAISGSEAVSTKHYFLRQRVSASNSLRDDQTLSWKIISEQKNVSSLSPSIPHNRTDFTFSLCFFGEWNLYENIEESSNLRYR